MSAPTPFPSFPLTVRSFVPRRRAIEELNINGLSPLRSSFSPKKLFGHEGKDDVLVTAADLQGQRSQESVDLVNSIVKASFDTQK